MNLVVIPAYRRPAMLAASLSTIQASPQACYQRYLFTIDRRSYGANEHVIATFQCGNIGKVSRRHNYAGYTFNVLEALRTAHDMLKPMDLVYVIAEDILVSQDVFAFHEDAHTIDPNAWFVSSTRGPRRILTSLDESPTIVYRGPFTDLRCISFKAWRLASLLDHAVRDYHRDMIGYCAKNLEPGGYATTDVEFPGLVRRVMHPTLGYGLYPLTPRAHHIGYVGTNRGGQTAIDRQLGNPSDWRENARQIIEMSADQLNALAEPRYRDIERSSLIRSRSPLRLV